MANTVYTGFGSYFGPTAATMDTVVSPSQALLRVISSQKGYRTILRRIQAAPTPLAALAGAGSAWQYLYWAVSTKFRFEELIANNKAILNSGPFNPIGFNPPGQDAMGTSFTPIWLARARLGVDPFNWEVNFECADGDSIIIACSSGVDRNDITGTNVPEPNHMEVLSVWGDENIPIESTSGFPGMNARSQPRFDTVPLRR